MFSILRLRLKIKQKISEDKFGEFLQNMLNSIHTCIRIPGNDMIDKLVHMVRDPVTFLTANDYNKNISFL